MTTFIVDSDLHFKHSIIAEKIDHTKKIIDECKKTHIDAVICPGDLTDNGWDGSKFLCWKYGGKYDQLTPLKEQYVDPIEKYTNVYLCPGNHDWYVPKPYIHHGVLKYIKKRHGGLRYSFDINDIHFICLGKYPDKDAIKFLIKDMEKHHNKNLVIFFHFNLSGKWSDWWTIEEKTMFYDTIKNQKVIALLVGHAHMSGLSEWNGFPVVMSAHEKIAKCTILEDKLTVDFI